MKNMGVNELRESFLSFFESKDHLRHGSFSVVPPANDKSLLLINAGMTPLKPYFAGTEVPPRRRMTTCQKCIRTGDLENVGKTARHGTFFEMLGNFSFGDYFKHEAIAWGWEYMTRVLEFDPDRLYVSVFEDDDEAEDIWHHEIGLPMSHIKRMGREDNFWEHGTGACGPCSEIYFDRGEKYGCGKPTCGVGCDCDRYMEIWNIVFSQYDRQEDGTYLPLKQKNIDTGMGLERLAAVMQGVDSIFDVDTVKAIRDHVCRIADVSYEEDHQTDVSIRIITDHIRSMTFMVSDGVLPSNEGRGYVLRRILRRAARHGRMLGVDHPFLTDLAETVIEQSGTAYPELIDKRQYILAVISNEEKNFYQTLDSGLNILQGFIDRMEIDGITQLDAGKAFKLFDTYGFPKDLTGEILKEKGFTYDEEGFQKAMQAQRELARAHQNKASSMLGRDTTVYDQLDPNMQTTFTGYDRTWSVGSVILAMTNDTEVLAGAGVGEKVTVFTDKTPFYATMGGQQGDFGTIQTDTGVVSVETTEMCGNKKIGHIGTVIDGQIYVGQKVRMVVDPANRLATARNHTSTHLLQKALRNVLGTHVEQHGSSVNADRLRFDFSHFQPMTKEEIDRVELEVNRKILEDLTVRTDIMSMDEARKTGAMALFDEKYGDEVRVVSIGDYSKELCGGTHLKNTAQAGSFKIISESGVAAGVRRIEALTGEKALFYYKEQEALINQVSSIIKDNKTHLADHVAAMVQQQKALEKEIALLKSQMTASAAGEILKNVKEINGVQVLCMYEKDENADGLKKLGDTLKDKLGECILVLAGGADKLQFVVMATPGAVKAGANAGSIVRAAAKAAGGGGGGKPQMAQAGAKDVTRVQDALNAAEDEIRNLLK